MPKKFLLHTIIGIYRMCNKKILLPADTLFSRQQYCIYIS